MSESYDRVYTVTDFWDRPRVGIADFCGQPHVYQSQFDDGADDWSDVYILRPIDSETLNLALEDWAIYLRWEAAFQAGQIGLETHPALPSERPRHEALQGFLQPRLNIETGPAIRVHGEFKRVSAAEQQTGDELVVYWKLTEG